MIKPFGKAKGLHFISPLPITKKSNEKTLYQATCRTISTILFETLGYYGTEDTFYLRLMIDGFEYDCIAVIEFSGAIHISNFVESKNNAYIKAIVPICNIYDLLISYMNHKVDENIYGKEKS